MAVKNEHVHNKERCNFSPIKLVTLIFMYFIGTGLFGRIINCHLSENIYQHYYITLDII